MIALTHLDKMPVGTYKGRMTMEQVPKKHLLYLFNNQGRKDVCKLPENVRQYILQNLEKLLA